MKTYSKYLMLAIAVLFSGQAMAVAYDCNTNCSEVAKFRYRCPTFSNPGRKCTAINPAKKAACEVDRAASCQFWNQVKQGVQGRIKSMLKPRFNAQTYAQAEQEGKEAEYLALCQSAGVAACAAVGAQIGGPWGAGLSGAIGVFVSYQLCHQSRHW